jgi:hypothetical protein
MHLTIFNIHTFVILGCEHSLPLHNLFIVDIQSQWDFLIQRPFVIKRYPHDTPLYSNLKIHDICSHIVPCKDGVVILIVIVIKHNVQFKLVLSHAFILIPWHGCLCLKHKNNLNCCKGQTFFPSVLDQL